MPNLWNAILSENSHLTILSSQKFSDGIQKTAHKAAHNLY